jgi:hypothetical protein
LPATLFPDYCDVAVRVTSGSTIRVKGNTYSVPSRLIGASVVARIHDLRLEIHFAGQVQLEVARLHGSGEHRINYRHLITSLVRKPGAFARYRFREDLFPTTAFRRAFDALTAQLSSRQAERHYLGILQLAAKTVEAEVERALVTLLETGRTPTLEALVAMTPSTATPRPPELQCQWQRHADLEPRLLAVVEDLQRPDDHRGGHRPHRASRLHPRVRRHELPDATGRVAEAVRRGAVDRSYGGRVTCPVRSKKKSPHGGQARPTGGARTPESAARSPDTGPNIRSRPPQNGEV